MKTPQLPSAFVGLWRPHGPRVYSYIYSLVANWSDADDVYQETSLVLFEKFSEFEPGTNFLAWACKVAHHKSLQCLSKRNRLEHFDEGFWQAIGEAELHLLDEAGPRLAALAECMKKLRAQDRVMINVRYHVGGTVQAVAEKTGRTTNVVYKSLRRIHETLLFCIRERLAKGDD